MSTLPDTPRYATGGDGADDALLQAVADMGPDWTVLRDCALAEGGQGASARVRFALLHPEAGIALIDVLPGAATPRAPDRLRRLLDAAGFRSVFGGYPPIVHLCVPSRALPGVEALLTREFDALPPLALAGGVEWVAAAQLAMTAEPPLRTPGRTAAGRWPFPIRSAGAEWAEGRPAPRAHLGFRGLAAFWGVVAVTFGGGTLVLQYLGPPEGHPAAARAGSAGLGPSRQAVPQPASEAWLTPPYPDKARPPPPGPMLALWPAEPMPTRFDAARSDAAARETGDSARAESRPVADRSAPVTAATPDRPRGLPVPVVPTETRPITAAEILAGLEATASDAGAADELPDPASVDDAASSADEAGNESAPAGALEAPSSVSRPYPPSAPAQAAGSEGAGAAPAASAVGRTTGTPAGDARTLGGGSQDSARHGDAPDAAAIASTGSPGSAAAERGDRAGVDAPPRPEEAEPAEVAGAETPDAPPTAAGAPTVHGEGAAPAPSPAADTAEAGQPGAAPSLTEAEAPSSPAALVAAPPVSAGEATDRPGAAQAPPARDAGPAQPVANVPVARPAMPEPDGKAPAQPQAGDKGSRVPPPPSASPALVEALIARGDAMVSRRDISAARLLYERAAGADARAASALAKTYDPAFLAEIGARGIRGDAALAAAWYRKAASLGDGGAPARAEALSGGPDPGVQGRP